jgi:hypothetical protein
MYNELMPLNYHGGISPSVVYTCCHQYLFFHLVMHLWLRQWFLWLNLTIAVFVKIYIFWRLICVMFVYEGNCMTIFTQNIIYQNLLTVAWRGKFRRPDSSTQRRDNKWLQPTSGRGEMGGQHKHIIIIIHCGIDEKNSILLNYYVNTLECN